jgi:hypothetical protein
MSSAAFAHSARIDTGLATICLLASSGCLPSFADDAVAVAVAVDDQVNVYVYDGRRAEIRNSETTHEAALRPFGASATNV